LRISPLTIFCRDFCFVDADDVDSFSEFKTLDDIEEEEKDLDHEDDDFEHEFTDFDPSDKETDDDEAWDDIDSEWSTEENDVEESYTLSNNFNSDVSQDVYKETITSQGSWTPAPVTPAIASQSKSNDDDYYNWNDNESSVSIGIVVLLAIAVVGVFYFIRGRSAPTQNTTRAGYRPVPHGAQVGPKSHTK
jgi:hypothetical protein